MDIIYQLGELAFATRLKRLSERLQRDVSRIYRELDLEFEARWFSVLYTLNENEEMTVTGLAEALGLTHPAVNQTAAEMSQRGLLLSGKDSRDERRRLLRLSAKGKTLAQDLAPIWKEISGATKELLAETDTDVLAMIEGIESALDSKGMYARMRERLLSHLDVVEDVVRIVDYAPSYKEDFRELNLDWIREYFTVEPTDEKILSDPNGAIIKKGGAVLFARRRKKIVGACALIKHSPETFELAKMAVSSEFRGQGIGSQLAKAIIQRARELGGKQLFLETSPKLKQALKLYQRLGFKEIDKKPVETDCLMRCSIPMSLTLN